MDNKVFNKTAEDIVKQVKEHIDGHSDYTAMTLVTDIVNENISNKPWEEPKRDIIENYINSDTVNILEDLGFKFEFYPYKEHTVEKNSIKTEVTDTWALALTWYRWTRLEDIFRRYGM